MQNTLALFRDRFGEGSAAGRLHPVFERALRRKVPYNPDAPSGFADFNYDTLNDACKNPNAYPRQHVLMPGRTEVWYWVDGHWLNECTLGRFPTVEQVRDEYKLLGRIKSTDPEGIFEALQAPNWSPRGEAQRFIRNKGLRHTSMSVGDVVRVPDGVWLVVANEGFVELEKAYASSGAVFPTFEQRYEEFIGRTKRRTDDFVRWVGDGVRGMFPPRTGLMGAPEQVSPVTYEELVRTAAASDPRVRAWDERAFERSPFGYVVGLFERGDFDRLDRLAESLAGLRVEWLERALDGEPRLTRDERAHYRERMDLYFDYWVGARKFVMEEGNEDCQYWDDAVSRQVWLFSVALAVPEYLKGCVGAVESIRPYVVELGDEPGAVFERLCREW